MNVVDALCPTCHCEFQYLTGTIPYCPYCREAKVFKPETSLHSIAVPVTRPNDSTKQINLPVTVGGTHV